MDYFDENYEQKCLCVLVLDTSGSMNNGAINDLNEGLSLFKEQIMQDPVAIDRLEIAIVTFNSDVEVIQEPCLFSNVSIPTLKATGQTQLVKAINQAQMIVEERKDYYKSSGIPYYRPWIVVMTDGEPYPAGQDVEGLSQKIHADVENKKYVYYMIGIGNEVQDSTLKKLSTDEFPPVRLDAVNFREFFTWLSASASVVVNDIIGDNHSNNSSIDWLNGFVIKTDAD